MKGNILKISRFCTDDGPGIRTTVFLKGCPLKCIWCHNPESQRPEPELWYNQGKCIGCRKCYDVCENGCHTFTDGTHNVDLNKCIACGKCADICPTKSLEISGKEVSADDIVREAEKDLVFYKNSGGGVTVSGGEPLLQWKFTAEILRLCREKGIHTAIETSGFGSTDALENILKYCNIVLFDIKEADEARHKEFTGVSRAVIIRNLKLINESGTPFIIRMPIIPGLNDTDEHFAYARELVRDMEYCKNIEVMPYHSLDVYKYGQLKREYLLDGVKEPDKETADKWRNKVKKTSE